VRGQAEQAFGYEITFNDLVLNKDNKYEFVLDIKKSGTDGSQSISDILHITRSQGQIRPLMYISEVNSGLMKEPDILISFVKDLYISPLNYDDGGSQAQNGTQISLAPEQETTISGVKVRYKELLKPDVSAMSSGGDFKMGVRLTVGEGKDSHPVDVMIQKEGNNFVAIPAEIPEAKVHISLSTIDHASKSVALVVTPNDGVHNQMMQPKEIFTVAVSTKPFISLVWIGVAIMVIGFAISTLRRLKESTSA
jgi:cytochrome c-type biogenesis protein CcmF